VNIENKQRLKKWKKIFLIQSKKVQLKKKPQLLKQTQKKTNRTCDKRGGGGNGGDDQCYAMLDTSAPPHFFPHLTPRIDADLFY
jgi:hypothetical protein